MREDLGFKTITVYFEQKETLYAEVEVPVGIDEDELDKYLRSLELEQAFWESDPRDCGDVESRFHSYEEHHDGMYPAADVAWYGEE